MNRNFFLNTVAKSKANGLIDTSIRYNPWLRGRVLNALRHWESDPSLASIEALTRRAMSAARQTPYGKYRTDDISDWPILEKERIRDAAMDFINRRAMVRIPASTGGTVGVPLKLWRSMECIVAEQIFLDKLLAPYGASMRSKTAILRANSVKLMDDTDAPYGYVSHGGQRLTLSHPHLNADTIDWFYEALQRFRPTILWVFPSAIINLIKLVEQKNLKLHIPIVFTSSEALSESTHATVEKLFGSKVINYYGQAERVCLAYGTKPNEFYFNPAYGRVELLAQESDLGGFVNCAKIIGTSYWNLAMPLVRYNTGDFIYVPRDYGKKELAEVAAGTRHFTGIGGREGEYLLTREGMQIMGLNHVPREVEHIFQLQLVQPDFDNLIINVLAMPGFNDRDAAHIRQQARAKVPKSMKIIVQTVDRLKHTARGKTPLIIREFAHA